MTRKLGSLPRCQFPKRVHDTFMKFASPLVVFGLVWASSAAAQTVAFVQDSCGRMLQPGPTPGVVTRSVWSASGPVRLQEPPRGVVTAYSLPADHSRSVFWQRSPRASVLVRDSSGRVIERIRYSPCGQREVLVDPCGRVIETRPIFLQPTLVFRFH